MSRVLKIGYPINFQSATYMENSHLDNARKYLLKNPDGNWKPIDNYLTSQNQTIRFGKNAANKYGKLDFGSVIFSCCSGVAVISFESD